MFAACGVVGVGANPPGDFVPADQLDYRPPPASQPDAVPPGAPAGVLQPRDDERQEGQEDAEQEALSGGRRRWLKINAA